MSTSYPRVALSVLLIAGCVLGVAVLADDPARLTERTPWLAALIGAAVGLSWAIGLLVPFASGVWSLGNGDVKALVFGVTLTLASMGGGAAYLGEHSSARIGTPPRLVLSGTGLESVEGKRGRKEPEGPSSDSAPEYAMTLSAEVTDCDSPVHLTAAFWPAEGGA